MKYKITSRKYIEISCMGSIGSRSDDERDEHERDSLRMTQDLWEYVLNLSISIKTGKEINKDSRSSGE